MNEEELYLAAARRAPHGGEGREVLTLRRFTHEAMMAGRIDGETQDRIGELIDAIARSRHSKVGDLVGPNADDIPWDALEVEDSEGDTWRRAFGDDRLAHADDPDDEHLYDWVSEGAWAATEGLLAYAPLRVTRVVTRF